MFFGRISGRILVACATVFAKATIFQSHMRTFRIFVSFSHLRVSFCITFSTCGIGLFFNPHICGKYANLIAYATFFSNRLYATVKLSKIRGNSRHHSSQDSSTFYFPQPAVFKTFFMYFKYIFSYLNFEYLLI